MSVVSVKLSAPLQPKTRDEIRALEAVLYTASLFKPEVLEMLSRVEDKTALISELYSVAGVLSRYRANYSYGLISKELDIPLAIVKKHTRGESDTSRILLGVLSELESRGGSIEVSIADIKALIDKLDKLEKENEELKRKTAELEAEVQRLSSTLSMVRERISEVLKALQ